MNAQRNTALIIGGTSDIGFAIARCFVEKKWDVSLAGRDAELLQRNAQDLTARYDRAVKTFRIDILRPEDFQNFIDILPNLPNVVISVVGFLGDQRLAQDDPQLALKIMRSNYEGPALLLNEFAFRFSKRGSGTLVGVSSVAGDRGRASNYFYGSAKAGFSTFLSGLRNRLAKENIHVITVKPGFVRTRMTRGLKLPAALTVDPDVVGQAVFQAVEKKRDVVYCHWVWQYVMTLIKLIPESLFKKLNL